jgi:hypothetical protein
MKSKLFLALMLAALMTPAAARAQNASADARINAALESAAEAGVPVALLESKIAEGRAKGVARERIAAAVEARLNALVRASETMERGRIRARTESEFAVAADALQAGVSEDALIRTYNGASAQARVVAVAVLTDLVRLGVASETALEAVSRTHGNAAALANLQAEVASKIRGRGLGTTLDATGVIRVH